MRDPAALDWPMQISFYESHGEVSWNMNIHGYVSASFSILLFRIFMKEKFNLQLTIVLIVIISVLQRS